MSSQNVQVDNDVHVTFEDQQKINKFARQNARLEDFMDELKGKKKELQNIEDALEELVLADDDDLIPYMLGEFFVNVKLETGKEMLEKAKERLNDDSTELDKQCEAIRDVMKDLKVQLYAKFGNNINLEPDDG